MFHVACETVDKIKLLKLEYFLRPLTSDGTMCQ